VGAVVKFLGRSTWSLLSERIDIANRRIDLLSQRPVVHNLTPDSIIVFEFPDRIPRAMYEHLKASWAPYPVMICEGGAKLKVIEKREGLNDDRSDR
jgi:hypothetical protein